MFPVQKIAVSGVTGTYDPVPSSTMNYIIIPYSDIRSSATITSDPYSSGAYSGYNYRHHLSWSYTAPSRIIHIERSNYSSGYYNMYDTIIPGFGYLGTSGHSIYSVLGRSGTTKHLASSGFSYTMGNGTEYQLTYTLSNDFKTINITAHYSSDSSTNNYSSGVGLGQLGKPSTTGYADNILILY